MDLTKYVETHEFVFDEAFDAESTNDDVRLFRLLADRYLQWARQVYSRTAFPLVEYIFSGGKATCFA